MSGFDENIVREYFELHGFLVRQLRKYQIQSRRKLAEEDIDFMVYNPAYKNTDRTPAFLLFSNELKYIHRAVVVVKGWHTLRFTPSMLRSSSEIFNFLEKNIIKKVEDFFQIDEDDVNGSHEILKILVLPGLPIHEPHRSESMKMLKDRGIDGIISFRSMLNDILNKVETNRNYQKSQVLQILRILKVYDLVKKPQMELFEPK